MPTRPCMPIRTPHQRRQHRHMPLHILTIIVRRMSNPRVTLSSTGKVVTGLGTGVAAGGAAAAVGTGAGSAKALAASAMREASPRANTAG
jgi:hypothetical protein